MARRAPGEGSLYFDEKEQLWIASVYIDGRKSRRKAKTKTAAAAKLKELRAARDLGAQAPDPRLTVAAWMERWLDRIDASSRSEETKKTYRAYNRDYVKPGVGHFTLTRLKVHHVDEWLNDMKKRGLSPNTCRQARATLAMALRDAQRVEVLPRGGPTVATLSASPQPPTRLDDALDAEEAVKVLDAASGDALEAFAYVALFTGLRNAELRRLRWDDVELEDDGQPCVLFVRRASTKTAAGVRSILLAPAVIDALRAHRARQLAEWTEHGMSDPGLVFTGPNGVPLTSRSALAYWHDLTERAGIGRRRLHASRHTAAVLMLNNGVALEIVSATLGHASLAITADVYATVGDKLSQQVPDVMQSVLGAR